MLQMHKEQLSGEHSILQELQWLETILGPQAQLSNSFLNIT